MDLKWINLRDIIQSFEVIYLSQIKGYQRDGCFLLYKIETYLQKILLTRDCQSKLLNMFGPVDGMLQCLLIGEYFTLLICHILDDEANGYRDNGNHGNKDDDVI